MGTVNGLYTTTSTTHNWYYSQQIKRQFKIAQSPLWSVYSNAAGSNTAYMLIVRFFLAEH